MGSIFHNIRDCCGNSRDVILFFNVICHKTEGRLSVDFIFSADRRMNLITHLCGGSAGREGAALQLGGSIGNG